MHAKRFEMSQQTLEEFTGILEAEWNDLVLQCKRHGTQSQSLKPKDIIIVRLYMTFMGKDFARVQDDCAFLQSVLQFMASIPNGKSMQEHLDPSANFVITEENKKRIKELLVNLQREKLLEDSSAS